MTEPVDEQPEEGDAPDVKSLVPVSNITEVLKENFGTYASYVIKQRAVPDVRDGLKPVHRRVLYTSYEIGAEYNKRHVKSAKITGTCMALYHPHGSAYGTMVRMAQPFSMRYPLMDGQGNFGSMDDDPAAAERYCIFSGTQIMLSDGTSKAVETLKVGDMVLTHRGVARPVERLLPMRHRELIRFELKSGLVFFTSPNHPLLVFINTKLVWVRAEFIKDVDSLCQVSDKNTGWINVNDVDSTVVTPEYNSFFALKNKSHTKKDTKGKFIQPVKIKSITRIKNPDPDNRTWDLQVAEDHTYLIGTSLQDHIVSHNTECRLSKIGQSLFFNDLNEDVVSWRLNYSEDNKEPSVLPAELPHLLMNGTEGIAVGLATSILPFNASELIDCLISEIDEDWLTNNPDKCHPSFTGPDFPTGGVVSKDKATLLSVWTEGRGSFKLRGSAKFETNEKNDKKNIIVYEIPWMMNKSAWLGDVARLIEEKNEDGKYIIDGVTNLRDESSKDEGVRIVFELSTKADPQVILNTLYRKTKLQDSYSCGIVVIDDNKPKRYGVRQCLLKWLTFRRECVTNNLKREQRLINDRLEIIEAYTKVHLNIDDVIKTIKNSENARDALKQKFKLTDRQTDAIVKMPLGKLRKIDHQELADEKKKLDERNTEITGTLQDPKKVDVLIRERLLWWKDQLDERRTRVVAEFDKIETIDLVVKEDVVMSVNEKDEIKLTRVSEYRKTRRGTQGVIEARESEDGGDSVRFLEKITTHDTLFVFTNKGMCHETTGHQLPITKRAGKGFLLRELFPEAVEGEKIVSVLSVNLDKLPEDSGVVMLTSDGEVKRLWTESLVRKKGMFCKCFELNEGAELVSTTLVTSTDNIGVFTKNGSVRHFPVSAVRMSKNKGCGGMKIGELKQDDRFIGVSRMDPDSSVITVTSNGFGARFPVRDIPFHKGRYCGGNVLIKCYEKTGRLVFATCMTPGAELFLTASDLTSARISTDKIKEVGRGAQGVILKKSEKNHEIVAAALITEIKD